MGGVERAVRFVHRLRDHQAQLRAAMEAELRQVEELTEQGWVWDEELRHWAHPDCPSTIISY